jgi:hypothetical protein
MFWSQCLAKKAIIGQKTGGMSKTTIFNETANLKFISFIFPIKKFTGSFAKNEKEFGGQFSTSAGVRHHSDNFIPKIGAFVRSTFNILRLQRGNHFETTKSSGRFMFGAKFVQSCQKHCQMLGKGRLFLLFMLKLILY